jgi:hypothetical protein
MKKEVEKMMGHEVKEPKNVKTNSGGPRWIMKENKNGSNSSRL